MMVPKPIASWLHRRIKPNRQPDFVVGEPAYLQRWWLLPRNKVCNVYLHVFLRDDDDRALHDHPWPSLSLLLSGSLEEVYLTPNGTRTRRLTSGAVTFRKPTFAHRLIVNEVGSTTLFLTGPRVREWGFHCPNGWRHWKLFTQLGDKGKIGRGCE